MTSTASAPSMVPDTAQHAARLLERQRAAFALRAPDYARRMEALRALGRGLVAREDEIVAAIASDFGGRSADESRLLELLPLADAIRHARRSLKRWMKPRRVGATWFLMPSRAYVVHQPLGVVGIIGAWNYPILLTLGPLVDALAAGNHAMIKPSEMTPNTAGVIARLIADAFPADYVSVLTGGPEFAAAFSALPFDHLFFTGSTRVGALVMGAASRNLTPVTLELGGKSPAIVHESYSMDTAMRRILVGKLVNAGQTCVAPDYLLVPRGSAAAVERAANELVPALYPRLVANPDYARILTPAHFARLADGVAQARDAGARVVTINPANEACAPYTRVFPPTLVFDPPQDGLLMREEIFGPVLPVVEYDTLDAAIAFVNARPRPLALYYFDGNRGRIDRVIAGTTAGGVTVNDVLLHLAQHNLPFGGIGPSGTGHYHGRYGFEQLSKAKGVMIQGRFPVTRWVSPPFTSGKQALVRRLLALARR